MNDEYTGGASTNETATDWERLHRIDEAKIHAAVSDDPEIIPTDADFWESAEVVTPQHKPTITDRA